MAEKLLEVKNLRVEFQHAAVLSLFWIIYPLALIAVSGLVLSVSPVAVNL